VAAPIGLLIASFKISFAVLMGDSAPPPPINDG
jgi:hypothetical protein